MRKINFKVIIYSLIALLCVVLMFIFKEWLFIIPAVILLYLNQRELSNPNKNKKK
jgi:hypothetical protein